MLSKNGKANMISDLFAREGRKKGRRKKTWNMNVWGKREGKNRYERKNVKKEKEQKSMRDFESIFV